MNRNNSEDKEEFSEENRPKIFINAPNIPQRGLDLLSAKCNLITCSNNCNREELLQKVRGVHGILWTDCSTKVDKEIIEAAGSDLRVVSAMSLEYDHIDIDELKRRKIPLGYTPEVVNNAIADVAVLLALAAARRFHEGRIQIEKGEWKRQTMLGKDLKESTIGIIGFNPIGQTIAKRLQAFDVSQILYTGQKEESGKDNIKAKQVELDQLLKESDFIIITVPLTKDTKSICNEDFFKKMKPTSIFVNVSRGEIVDQVALIKALKTGQIYAAGLDSTIPEPLPKNHELLSLPNCVLTPNLGCATESTADEMSYISALNILMGIGRQPLITPVYEL